MLLNSLREYFRQRKERAFQQVIKTEAEKELQSKTWVGNELQIKSKLTELKTDYLKAFIDRIGLRHFSSLSLIATKTDWDLSTYGIDLFIQENKALLEHIEEDTSRSTSIQQAQNTTYEKDIIESLLIVTEKLPKLRDVLERKGIALSYSNLVDLLIIKYNEMNEVLINSSKEELITSLNKLTLLLLVKMKGEKTKESVARALATALMICLKKSHSNLDDNLSTMPNFISESLNYLLKKFNIILEDLPQDEINDLINNKIKEVETDAFEEELISGTKPSEIFPSKIDALSGADFESLLEKLFKLLGYLVMKTPLTRDQGADLVLEKDGEKIVVQAKRYNGVVSNKAIQEAVASINYYKCNRAIVVTTSTFTRSALNLAVSNKVELWDGKKLKEIINSFRDRTALTNSLAEDDEIGSLLPKEYITNSLPTKSLFVKVQEEIAVQKVKTKCIYCESEIELSLNLKEIETKGEVFFEKECPHCKNIVKGSQKIGKYGDVNFPTKNFKEK